MSDLSLERVDDSPASTARLLSLEQEAFGPESYGPWGVASLCGHGAGYVLRRQGRDVGHALLMPHWREPWRAYLGSFAIAPGEQGHGLGKAFLALLITALTEQGFTRLELTVDPTNEAARRLYLAFGFRDTAFVRDCYGPGTDRKVMVCGLHPGEERPQVPRRGRKP